MAARRAVMELQRQVTFWIAALIMLIALVWLLSDVLLPFVAGMVLAYLLDPIARRAARLGIGRGLSALIILTIVIGALVVAAMLIAPVVAQQSTAFIEALPGYVTKLQAIVTDPGRPWLSKVFGSEASDPSKSVGDLVKQSSGFISGFLVSLWSGGKALFSILSLLIITPVVAFYLLVDWDRVVATVDGWIPLQHRETIRGLAREIDDAIAGFMRGQAVICLILAFFYAIGLTFTGLHSGFLIGLMTGLLSFIPYVGAATGFLVAIVVALAQFWPNFTPIVLVIGVFLIGQVLEGYVLSPNLVGPKVGLHPVWMMFALIAFGYLFGFVGLLIAIPLAATIGVLARFVLRKYLESPIYTGQGPAA